MQLNAIVRAIINSKGGVGKTSYVINQAYRELKAGKKVLVIDADEQKTFAKYNALREENLEVMGLSGLVECSEKTIAIPKAVKDNLHSYDVIYIDTPGNNSPSMRAALSVANESYLPYPASSFDLAELRKLLNIVAEAKQNNADLQSFIFMNNIDKRGKANLRNFKGIAQTILDTFLAEWEADSYEAGIFILDTYISSIDSVYNKMGLEGKTAFELQGKFTCVTEEHDALAAEVQAILKASQNRRVAA
jgi:chromosome partitioning protein